ncbi:MAG: tetratricopeptide repeat protein, partial [Vicinamibacterales bacterium]
TVRQRLAHEDVRLVTLTGPGGTGKTRLALQVAVELVGLYADGVFFVDLASISDPALLVPTIAQVLGVAETDDRPILDSLLDYLRRRHMLLLLDNFEQILDAAGTLDALLHTCPGLAILVTSRAPLQLRVEHESPVPPLGVPDVRRLQQPGLQAEALSRYDAVELFVERALAIRPDFILTNTNASAVAELCARLDGLPLAIELAAARLRLLSPEAMLPRLGHGLDLLAGGRRDLPARQQTLRNTIAWSYELLSATERRLFRHLSVFVGGFTLAAAAAVCGTTLVPGPASDPGSETRRSAEIDVLDVIGALVDHNLLRPTEVTADEPRFAMLETIREYGLEQLEASGEKDDVRRLHLAWCVDLSNRSAQLGRGAAQGAWLDRLEAEYDNLRAALRCSEAASCDPEIGLRLATTLANAFWPMRGHFHEGRGWLTRLLARPTARTVVRADALNRAGYLAMRQNDYAAALPLFDEALAIWRDIGDANGTAVTLRNLGVVAHHQGDHDRARTMFEESLPLHRQLGDRYGVQMSQLYFADLLRDCGEDARAATSYEEGLNLARERGDGHGVAYALRGLGHMARVRGDYARAGELLRESLELLRPLRDRRCIPLCLEGLACIAIGPDWADRATRLLGAANAIQSNTGAPAPPSELADYQRTEADARSTLGMEQFAAVWAEGTMLPLDAVIAYALEGAGEAHTASARAPSPRPVLVAPSESSAAVRTQPPDGPRLSARECEVVTLIAGGLSNRQIAERLVLSVRTVERHIENVYNRLGISGKAGRAIVTAYAIRHHLIDSL